MGGGWHCFERSCDRRDRDSTAARERSWVKASHAIPSCSREAKFERGFSKSAILEQHDFVKKSREGSDSALVRHAARESAIPSRQKCCNRCKMLSKSPAKRGVSAPVVEASHAWRAGGLEVVSDCCEVTYDRALDFHSIGGVW